MAQRDLIVREFLECLEERAEREFKGKVHQAFVAWYIEAEFGRHAKWDFTDGPNDGGIDAIVRCPMEMPPVFVIQSKFTENIGKVQLMRKAYTDFRKVVKAFRRPDDYFEDCFGTVSDELRHRYRHAMEELRDLNL